jgi:hypothetical protein
MALQKSHEEDRFDAFKRVYPYRSHSVVSADPSRIDLKELTGLPEHDLDYYIAQCQHGLRVDPNNRTIHRDDVEEFLRRADKISYIWPEHDPGWEHLH